MFSPKQVTKNEEIQDAASQENSVGLTPVDIAMEIVCGDRQNKLKSNRHSTRRSFCQTSDQDSDLRTYTIIRYDCSEISGHS